MGFCGICRNSPQAYINLQSIYLNEYDLREIFHELVQTDLPSEDYSTILICENDANKMVEFHHFRKKLLEAKGRFGILDKPENVEDENDSFSFVANIKTEDGSNEIFACSLDQTSQSFHNDDRASSTDNISCEKMDNVTESQLHANSAQQEIFICRFCSRRFFNFSKIKRHLRKTHGKTNDEIKENSTYTRSFMEKSMRRFECPLCHQRFNYLYELRPHLIKSHQLQRKFGAYDIETLHTPGGDHKQSNDFKCPKCNREFGHKNEFRKHLYGHRDMDKTLIDLIAGPSKNTKEYKCEKCYSSFWRKSFFIRHFHESHLKIEGDVTSRFPFGNITDKLSPGVEQEDTFKCTLCPGFFEIVEDLQKHLYAAHCRRYCKESVLSTPGYNEPNSGDKPQMYTCICGRTFRNSKKYFNHFQYNHMKLGEESPKRCPFCISAFAFDKPGLYSSFLSHIAKCHTEEVKEDESLNGMVECPDCDQLHVTSVELYRHYKLVHFTNDRDNDEGYNLDCEPCKITINSSYEYFEHQKMVHGISNKRSVKPIKCNWCNMRVGNAGRLGVHIRSTHHQHRIRQLEEGQEQGIFNVARDNESLLCSICGKIMKNASLLSPHIGSHNEERSFKCLLCQKSFKSEQTLKVHQREIHSEKEFKCDFCSKMFKNIAARKQHLLSHGYGAVNNTCKICGKNFNRSTNLKTHMWTHQSGQPYNCPACGKGFARKNKMMVHLESEHEIIATENQ